MSDAHEPRRRLPCEAPFIVAGRWSLLSEYEHPFRVPHRMRREIPLKILVVGDFTRRSKRPPLSERSPVRVDRDRFERVLADQGLSLALEVGTKVNGQHAVSALEVSVSTLRDLSPLAIAHNTPVLKRLFDYRQTLLRGLFGGQWKALDGNVRALITRMRSASLMIADERALDELAGLASGSDLDLLKRGLRTVLEAAAASPVAAGEARESLFDALLSECDTAISTLVKEILHHPEVRALETNWRALRLLLDRVPSEENIEVDFCDCTARELAEDLNASDGQRSWLGSLLTWKRHPESPYALVVALHEFTDASGDGALLERIADVCAAANAVFLADASPTLVGVRSWVEVGTDAHVEPHEPSSAWWSAFRQRESARHVALCTQRVLLRRPYGSTAVPVHGWSFEELPTLAHGTLLWGGTAVLLAARIVASFARHRHGGDVLGEEAALPTFEHGEGMLLKVEGPLDLSFDECESESLSHTGFIVWRVDAMSGAARLAVARTAARREPEPSSQLAHVLLGDRLMHHLADAPYDQRWTHLSVEQFRFVLRGFVGMSTEADELLRARRPLRGAQLSEIGGGPGRMQVALEAQLYPAGGAAGVTIVTAGTIVYE